MSENHLSDLRFDSLPLEETVLAGIRDAGFEYCTPIQAQTLPIALAPRDVAGQAQTGTGKTAAFLLVIFNRLLQDESKDHGNNPRSLVVRSPEVRERLLARCKVSNPGNDGEALKALYKRFVNAREKTGEKKRQISYQKFVRGISRQTENLQKSAGCAEIELRLVIQDQKVQLKARPGR